ncbi:MAG: hypothetical protein IJC76_01890 [Lachnospiraceae bacterium]|nr:hypothetical protein [Lachnospiraceae bacterium]
MINSSKKNLKKIIAFICVVTIISSSTFSNVYITEAEGASFWQFFERIFNNNKKPEKETTTQEVTTTIKFTEEETTIVAIPEQTTEPEVTTQKVIEETTEKVIEETTEEQHTKDSVKVTEEETTKLTEEETTEKSTEEETTIRGLTPGIANKKEISTDKVDYKTSLVADTSKLKFYVDGDNYRFAITSSGKEVIAFKDADGTFIDTIKGAGEYVIRDKSFWGYISYPTAINGYKETIEDGVKTVTVSYNTSNATATSSTTYKFYDNHINVVANIDNVTNTAEVGDSYFQRSFYNDFIDSELRQNQKWVFPEDGDFPYNDFESIVITHYFDSEHKLYTFYRGENANSCKYFDTYSNEHLPLIVEDNNLTEYELTYDLVFENLTDDRDSDYLALFESTEEAMAVGITPVTKSVASSTIFTTPNVEFNINLTNLLERATKYDIEYRIYDYYGKVYNETEEKGSVEADREKNYSVSMKNMKQGIYYLDLLVTTETGEYHELYPFGYLKNHTYRYNKTSPFGISGVRFGDYQQNDTTIELMALLGMANARVGISKPEYVNETYDLLVNCLSRLKENDVNITGQYLLMNDWSFSTDGEAFAAEMDTALSYVSEYLDNVEVGNETNLYPVYDTLEEAMERYLECEYRPGYSVVKEKYNLPIIGSGVYLCKTDWYMLMYKSGLYDNMDILSTHAYSFPHSPDATADMSISHSFESCLARTRDLLNNAGDKEWHLTEMGYPTTPNNKKDMFSGVDLRTQADYTFREFILALSYGADVVDSYGFYDQQNMQKGTNPDGAEYHYGMFYDQDYYGRVMPKPLAIAYGSMTRKLESIKGCYGIETSSKTIRAFQLDLEESDTSTFVLWSNCSPLTNNAVDGYRTVNLPWNNQWEKTENVVLYASSIIEVTDIMGNVTLYTPDEKDATVTIPVSGSPIIVSGSLHGEK